MNLTGRLSAAFVGGMRAVLERDFLVFTSAGKFLTLRTTLVVLAAALAGLVFIDASPDANPDRAGQAIFMVGVVGLPPLLLLLTPALSASAIANERALGTLSLVLAAPVSPLGFVTAKFLSRLATALVLYLGLLPICAMCFLYGGVSGGLFLQWAILCVCCAVFGTAAGIVASAHARSVATAVLCAYGLSVGLLAVHGTLAGIVLANTRGAGAATAQSILEPNPGYVWIMIMLSGARLGTSTATVGPVAVAVGAFCVLTLSLSTGRLAREAQVEARQGSRDRRARGLTFENPVLDRGTRGTLVKRPRRRILPGLIPLLIIEALVLGIAIEGNDLDKRWPHVTVFCLSLLPILVTVAVRASNAFAVERQEGSFDLLMASPLSAREIVSGKFLSVLAGVAPSMVLLAVHAALAVPLSGLEAGPTLAFFLVATVLLFLTAAYSLRISLTATTAGRAVLASVAILFGGPVVHGVLLLIVGIVSDGSDSVMSAVGTANPVTLLVFPVVELHEGHISRSEAGMLAGCLFWLFVYAALAIRLWLVLPERLEGSRG